MQKITLQEFLNNCKSGDIMLFQGNTIYSWIIEWFCGSNISHVGIIIIDPFINNEIKKGIYLLESELYNNKQCGVRLTPIDDVNISAYSHIYVRFLNHVRDTNFKLQIDAICQSTVGKSYDYRLDDWFKAAFGFTFGDVHKTNEFWCAALATYIYIRLGFLNGNIPWTIIKPAALSSNYANALNFRCELSNDIEINYDK